MNIDSAIRSSTSDDWEYLAEGGAHLVFAYRGPSPFLKSKVMRVRKDRLSGAPEVQQQDTSYDVARDYLSHRIMPSLVPPDILPTEGRFTVNKKWIQKLLDSSNDARPASRLSSSNVPPVKSNSNTLNNDVIEVSLVENLLGGESDLAVEIKVRMGGVAQTHSTVTS
ncbi:hypothetical protein QFC19_006795 [Naganishia cerealis]|uniref:Uncharacterized protein n=1 Tax=Naganishia cerealis TaxID=610337 RepID=A0ACC2VEQ9_9TREE|nr:hypothetical protein QFC19_006795 [Naganishia cerealis]